MTMLSIILSLRSVNNKLEFEQLTHACDRNACIKIV